jgi:hypothetical protein
MMGCEAARLARSAVDDVVRTAGSGAVQIRRIAHDLLTGWSRPELPAEEDVARRLARERLGLPVVS